MGLSGYAMSATELILFDCDGVLIDSEVLAIRADIECLALHGIEVSVDHIKAHYIGVSPKTMIADIEERFGRRLPTTFEERLQQRITALLEAELEAIPGMGLLLDSLLMPICVASSSAPDRLKHSLSLVGLYEHFAPHIFSASQVARGKPAPDLFIFAAQQMRTPVSHCLVIEDSVAGVQAAKAAGMRVFGFCGGGHCAIGHDNRLLDAGADAVFKHADELASAIAVVSSG
jgi:HAD superfamily hydrolase (TIGR01509 family)